MTIHSIAVGVAKRNDFTNAEESVGEVRWLEGELPPRAIFFEAIEQMYARIELPWFPASAWVEVETDLGTKRIDAEEPGGEPSRVASVLWTWGSAGRGFG